MLLVEIHALARSLFCDGFCVNRARGLTWEAHTHVGDDDTHGCLVSGGSVAQRGGGGAAELGHACRLATRCRDRRRAADATVQSSSAFPGHWNSGSSGKQDKKRKSDAAVFTIYSGPERYRVAGRQAQEEEGEAHSRCPSSLGYDALKDQMRRTPEEAGGGPAAPARWENNESAPFPRGGGSALTPLEHEAVVAAAAKRHSLRSRSGGQRQWWRRWHQRRCIRSATLPEEAPSSSAHSLRRKALVGGVRALCAVSDVSSERLIVQLPSRLLGKVDREEVSDELYALASQENGPPLPDLRKLFTVGEVLCCAVLPAARAGSVSTARESRKGRGAPPVELTLRLSIVQRAADRLAAASRRPPALGYRQERRGVRLGHGHGTRAAASPTPAARL